MALPKYSAAISAITNRPTTGKVPRERGRGNATATTGASSAFAARSAGFPSTVVTSATGETVVSGGAGAVCVRSMPGIEQVCQIVGVFFLD